MVPTNTMMGCLLVHLACLLYAAQWACAWQLSLPQIQPITTALRQYSPRSTTTLKASQQNQPLEFFQKKDKKDTFRSVEDFDQDLAAEIQEALLSVNDDGMIGSTAESPPNEQPTISAAAADSKHTSSDATPIIIRPPIQNKVPKMDTTPAHTSLARVMANQLNIDLSSVTPSNGAKITASDVEYHAWKLSQPPSTPEALARAHQLGLDLNTLYDDEDRDYVMQVSDVQLYEENIRSLKVVSQKRIGVSNVNSKQRQRTKKLSALDERMEKRMEFIAKKLGNVAGGIAKQVRTNDFKVVLNGIKKKKDAPEIKSVQDFDAALAIEIQEDLICADSNNESNSHTQNIESDKSPQYYIDADANDELETGQSISDVDADADNELETIHTSMTVADIKGQLRTHGMKVSGNKSELAKRLCTLKRLQSMTVEQLKQELRNQDLKIGGKKAELVERLLDAKENEKKAERSLFFVDLQ